MLTNDEGLRMKYESGLQPWNLWFIRMEYEYGLQPCNLLYIQTNRHTEMTCLPSSRNLPTY